MEKSKQLQGSTNTFCITNQNDSLAYWIENFLYDRKYQNMAKGTLYFYQVKLKTFLEYCDCFQITRMNQVTTYTLREFITWLEEKNHNPGGRHAIYRAVKTFFLWYEEEAEPENWKNPIRKVKPPRVPLEPLDPAPIAAIQAIENTCNQTLLGLRDKAIILTLLDTGVRAQELLQMDITDLNLITGEILVKQGKGRKPRTVFIGSKTKRTLRNYLNKRNDPIPALWITNSNYHKLTYSGLVWVIKRRSKTAGVDNIPLHSFRRQFALSMLRRGVDILTISRIMGHTSLAVINRYVKQLNSDLQNGHIKGSPVDHENF